MNKIWPCALTSFWILNFKQFLDMYVGQISVCILCVLTNRDKKRGIEYKVCLKTFFLKLTFSFMYSLTYWVNYFAAIIIHIPMKNNRSKAHVNFDIIRLDQTASSDLEII